MKFSHCNMSGAATIGLLLASIVVGSGCQVAPWKGKRSQKPHPRVSELNEQLSKVIQNREAIEHADCLCDGDRTRLVAALEAIPYPISSGATSSGIRSYRKPLFAEYRLSEVDQHGNRVIYSARHTRLRFEFDHDADCWQFVSTAPESR